MKAAISDASWLTKFSPRARFFMEKETRKELTDLCYEDFFFWWAAKKRGRNRQNHHDARQSKRLGKRHDDAFDSMAELLLARDLAMLDNRWFDRWFKTLPFLLSFESNPSLSHLTLTTYF